MEERAALGDNQVTTGAFILCLIWLKTARRYSGPNELMFADAKIHFYADSLSYAIKEV